MAFSRCSARLRRAISGLQILLSLGAFAPAGALCAAPTISASDLYTGLEYGLDQVPEFQFIRAEARRLGVRVYLFGGTAASLAHYVKWDVQRKKGDEHLQKERFDYDLINIYRSTQDLDLVVDGPESAAKELARTLQKKFPYLQGSKDAWEVRLLREKSGDKEALLENPDFLAQHTDSNSTGLIEISERSAKEPRHTLVRDLRQWDSPQPAFLEDVRKGTLHYYFSDRHGETVRAKEGLNPPILSVIRYLTKAFQFELEIPPADEAQLLKVIRSFNPAQVPDLSTYVQKWIEKNGQKLYQHAVNVDYASRKLDELGLKAKLLDIPHGDRTKEGTLAWWLNREPLPEFPVGGAPGRTAAELGIARVAHTTKDYLAYENITRSPTGIPNVFVSREERTGEYAAHGKGFYTALGDHGTKGAEFNVRFTVDPRARDGVDFTWLPKEKYVLFHNRAALRIIPESFDLDPVHYFRARAEETNESPLNQGVIQRHKRKTLERFAQLSAPEQDAIHGIAADIVRRALVIPEYVNIDDLSKSEFYDRYETYESYTYERDHEEALEVARIRYNAASVLDAWIELPASARMSGSFSPAVEYFRFLAGTPFNKSLCNFRFAKALEQAFRQSRDALSPAQLREIRTIVQTAVKLPERALDREVLLATNQQFSRVLKAWFALPESVRDAKTTRLIQAGLKARVLEVDDGRVQTALAEESFAIPEIARVPALIDLLVKYGDRYVDSSIAKHVLTIPTVASLRESIAAIIERGAHGALSTLIEDVFPLPHAAGHVDLLPKLLAAGKTPEIRAAVEQLALKKLVGLPQFGPIMKELIQTFMDSRDPAKWQLLAEHAFSNPDAPVTDAQLLHLIENGSPQVLSALAHSTFSKPHAARMTPALRRLFERTSRDHDFNLEFKTLSALREPPTSISSETFMEFYWAMRRQGEEKRKHLDQAFALHEADQRTKTPIVAGPACIARRIRGDSSKKALSFSGRAPSSK